MFRRLRTWWHVRELSDRGSVEAARALGTLRDPRAVQPLVEALGRLGRVTGTETDEEGMGFPPPWPSGFVASGRGTLVNLGAAAGSSGTDPGGRFSQLPAWESAVAAL